MYSGSIRSSIVGGCARLDMDAECKQPILAQSSTWVLAWKMANRRTRYGMIIDINAGHCAYEFKDATRHIDQHVVGLPVNMYATCN